MWRISAMLLFLNASMLCGQRNPAAVMGMRIKSASQRGGMIAVITTGAKFELDAQGNIHCWQRIPRDRHALQISFARAVGPFRIQNKDGFSCTVSCQVGTLTFQADSLVILNLKEPVQVAFKGFFKPAYSFEKDGKWILMDADGGFGIYPTANKTTTIPFFSEVPWDVAYDFSSGDEAWLSVFPPRPYNWKRAFAAIEHDGLPAEYTPAQLEGAGAYPSNGLIRAAAKHCKVYTLHAYIWQDAPEDVKERMTPILQGYDTNTPKSGEYFDTVPTTRLIDTAPRHGVFIWREGQQWSQAESKVALAQFDKDYYARSNCSVRRGKAEEEPEVKQIGIAS